MKHTDFVDVKLLARQILRNTTKTTEQYLIVRSDKSIAYVTHSFIHSYSFNVQVDITQLQTDRKARKEDRIFIYVAVSSN